MKKILPLLSLFILLFVFTCENEPLEGEFASEDDVTCETALQNTIDAALAFVNFTEDNYTELCNAYKTALQAQIDACGDPDGSLQSGIDALGNCIPGTGNDCENATEASNLAQVNFENADTDSYTDLCNAYKLVLENQITECGDDDGSIQTLIDGLGDCNNNATPQDCDLVLNTGGQPDYSEFEDLVFPYAMYKDVGIVDRDDNGIANHFFRILILSTDPIIFNDDGSFNSIDSDNPSTIQLNLNCYNVTEFISASFAPFWSPNRSNESYIDFGTRFNSNCTSIMDDDFVCDISYSFADSVVISQVDGESINICFDLMFNGVLEGIQGTYSGVPIETFGDTFN